MKHHLLSLLLITAAGSLCYAGTLDAPFIFDDFTNIVDNAHIRLSEIRLDAIAEAGWQSPSHRRPVANISFALNYLFGGYDVRGFHIANIFIHIINSLLVYAFSLALLRDRVDAGAGNRLRNSLPFDRHGLSYGIPLLAGLIFAIHPVQIQSVTYIVQRMNSLATLFYLASFLLYRSGRITLAQPKRYLPWSVGFLFWILALGAKEIAITLPVAVGLYEWFIVRDLRIGWTRIHAIAVAGVICLLATVTAIVVGESVYSGIISSYEGRDFGIMQRLLTQPGVIVLYISLVLFPHPSRLNLLHPVTVSESVIDPLSTLYAMVLILVLIATAAVFARRYRLFSFCTFWFFLHMIVESTVIGLEMIYEHRLYLPMVGVSFLSAYAFYALLHRKRLWLGTVGVSIVVLLGSATVARNQIWLDNGILWQDVLSKHPDSHRAHNNLGIIHKDEGNSEKAAYHYRKALGIKPNANAHNNLGVILDKQGKLSEAIPHYESALLLRTRFAEAHNNYGVVLEKLDRFPEAIEHFLEALDIKPTYVEAYVNLGTALVRQGNLKGAVAAFTSAMDLDPENAGVHNNLGIALEKQGKINQAKAAYKQAIALDPEYGEAYNNLGIVLAKEGEYAEAVGYFSEALRIHPDREETRRNLGLVRKRMEQVSGVSVRVSGTAP